MTTTGGTNDAHAQDSMKLRSRWGWFVALGVLFLIFGFIALGNIVLATVVSVYAVGILLLIAGVAQIVQSFGVQTWGGFFFWLISGILYAVAGFFAFYNPALTATMLTLMLAILLIVSGIFRVVAGVRYRPMPGWGWLVVSGVITTIAGLIFLLGWPFNSLFLLGLVLAFDLLFQGVSAIAFGFVVRSARPSQ